MKKSFRYIFAILLASIITIEGFPSTQLLREDIKVEKQFFFKSGGQGSYELNISYPLIRYSSPEVNHNVNLDIQRIMIMAITDFTDKLVEIGKTDGFSSLTLDYKVYFHHADILSLKFIKHTIIAGNPKPTIFSLTYNYDLKNEKGIQLKDLFLEEGEYKGRVIELAEDRVGNCRFKEESALKNFCLDPEGIVLNINQFSKNKRNCKNEVKIAWEEVGDLMKEDGIANLFFQR